MSDQSEVESSEGYTSEEENIEENNRPQKIEKKLEVLRQQNDPTCATYVFNNEDHTLGNTLRVILAGHHEVQFVGYSIPHPSETKMNLRLQTTGADTTDILNEGLKNVESICKIIRKKFEDAIKAHK